MCHPSLEHLTKSFFLVRMMRSNPPSRRVRVQRVLFFLLTITLTLSLKGQGKANTKSPVLSTVHHSWLGVCNKVSLYFGQHSTCFCMLRKLLAANSYSSSIIGYFAENLQNCSGNFGQRFVSIGWSGVSSTLCHCKCGSLWLLFRLIISSLWSSGLQCFHWFSLWW